MINSGTNIHSSAYFITLVLLAVSIPLSKFTMSVTEFMLLGLWLWSGFSFSISYRIFKVGGVFRGIYDMFIYVILLGYNNLKEKFGLFFKNKPVLIFTLIYFLHIIGLLYSSDISYGIKDLRIKIPILILPLIISTMNPIPYKKLKQLLLIYTLSVLISTLVSFYIFLTTQYIDIREISVFISPIRLGLNVSFSFFIMIYFIFYDRKFTYWQIGIMVLLAIWFLSFLFLLEAITSVVVIFVVIIFYLSIRVKNSTFLWQKLVFLSLVILIPVFSFIYVRNIIIDATTADKVNIEELDSYTKSGNKYVHDTTFSRIENGRYVGLYVCRPELRKEWNKRSAIDFDDNTDAGYAVSITLIRYLTSKDLRKDKEGVDALSDEDIRLIESGIANYNYIYSPGLHTRLLKMILGYEVYQKAGNPNGSSIMQRYEYLKASINIISDNFLFGVGTGDLEDAFYNEFNKMNSALDYRYRYHAHNQYLGIFVGLGLFGVIVFIFGLFYPVYVLSGFKDYFFGVFFIIMLVSMFSDDTIETQSGVTMFAFFYSLLLFGRKQGDKMPAKIHPKQ